MEYNFVCGVEINVRNYILKFLFRDGKFYQCLSAEFVVQYL